MKCQLIRYVLAFVTDTSEIGRNVYAITDSIHTSSPRIIAGRIAPSFDHRWQGCSIPRSDEGLSVVKPELSAVSITREQWKENCFCSCGKRWERWLPANTHLRCKCVNYFCELWVFIALCFSSIKTWFISPPPMCRKDTNFCHCQLLCEPAYT